MKNYVLILAMLLPASIAYPLKKDSSTLEKIKGYGYSLMPICLGVATGVSNTLFSKKSPTLPEPTVVKKAQYGLTVASQTALAAGLGYTMTKLIGLNQALFFMCNATGFNLENKNTKSKFLLQYPIPMIIPALGASSFYCARAATKNCLSLKSMLQRNK